MGYSVARSKKSLSRLSFFSGPIELTRNTTTNKTIRLSLADGSGQTKCLAVSLPLGILRTGIYDANVSPSCKKQL